MKEIILNRGYITFVDDEDYEELNQYKWHIFTVRQSNTIYVQRSFYNDFIKCQDTILMHREIMKLNKNDGKRIDHIDRNGLNNCKSNLRVITQ